MLWLAIGLAHGLLLWRGDILTTMPSAGPSPYFRHMAPWQLIKIAIALMLVPTAS